MKYKLLLVICSIWMLSFSQRSCEVKFKGIYAFEISPEMYSGDDMIYRAAAFIKYSGKRLQYEEGIFLPETLILSNTDSTCSNFNKNSSSDSIYRVIETIETKTITRSRHRAFKLYNITFQSIYLGTRKSFIRVNSSRVYKKIPNYLITKILDISAIK